MKKMRAYVADCWRTGAVPRVDELAQRLGISRVTLTQKFRAATGRSPGAAIHAMQLHRAMYLLRRTEQTTATIARGAGYGSTRTFYRAFRRALGISPSDYRRRYKNSSHRRLPPS
jgi:AraC-like DNA-binding protein